MPRSTPLDSSDPAVFERWCQKNTDQTLLEYCYEAPWEEVCTHHGTDDCAVCVSTGQLRASFEMRPGALIVLPAGRDLRTLVDEGPSFYRGKPVLVDAETGEILLEPPSEREPIG